MIVLKVTSVITFIIFLSITNAGITGAFEDTNNYGTAMGNDTGYISCICGDSDETIMKPLEAETAKEFFAVLNSSHGHAAEDFKSFSTIFHYLSRCVYCQIFYTSCEGNLNVTSYYSCTEMSVEIDISNLKSANDSKLIMNEMAASKIILKGNKVSSGVISTSSCTDGGCHRQKRYPAESNCDIPDSVKKSDLACVMFESGVKCIQRCIFGHRLEDGIIQHMECKYKGMKWEPTGITECRPFVNCYVTLIRPGSIKCRYGSFTKEPQCDLECFVFGYIPSEPRKRHTCSIEGKWEPPLPGCVVPRSDIGLLESPEIKLHDHESLKDDIKSRLMVSYPEDDSYAENKEEDSE